MRRLAVLFFIFSFILSGCRSLPESEGVEPDWITTLPESDSSTVYFVVDETAGSEEDALKQSARDLTDQILSFLGFHTSHSVNAESASDDLSDKLYQLLSGRGFLSGFKVVDTYSTQVGEQSRFAALVSYDREKLKEKGEELSSSFWLPSDRIQAAMDQVVLLEEEGSLFAAALVKLELAELLASSETAPAWLVEETVYEASELFSRVDLLSLSGPVTARRGKPVNQAYILQVISDEETGRKGQDHAFILVEFEEKKRDGTLGWRTANLVADSDGLVSFILPPPEFTGETSVRFSLTAAPELIQFKDQGILDQNSLVQIEKGLAEKKRIEPLIVESNPKTITTGILILDTDMVKKPLAERETERQVISSLRDAEFDVQALDLDPGVLISMNQSELLRDFRAAYAGSFERILYGVASLDGFEESSAGYVVKTKGELILLDLRTGEILLEQSLSKQVQGEDLQQSISASFRQLGRSLGVLMTEIIP